MQGGSALLSDVDLGLDSTFGGALLARFALGECNTLVLLEASLGVLGTSVLLLLPLFPWTTVRDCTFNDASISPVED